MQKEEEILKKRFLELADKTFSRGIYTNTGFLNLAEVELLHSIIKEIDHVPFRLYGGAENCERQVLYFGSEGLCGYVEEFPVAILCIKPKSTRFSDDLTHRDFLGALMNLGIERHTLGDIVLEKNIAYLFCMKSIAGFVIEELNQVKHTDVSCEVVVELPVNREQAFVVHKESVSSERADAVIARVWHMSRNQAQELFQAKCVTVNNRLIENNSLMLKKGDRVSVRGYGKFLYAGIQYESKKGKFVVEIHKLI